MPRSDTLCDCGISAFSLQQPGGLRVVDDSAGGEDRLRIGEPLHARRDVDRLAEIVLPLVQRHRDAGPLVHADLEQQILAAVAAVERRIASRILSAAAIARSGVGNVAITASPIVLTTAPASAATISCRTWKCARTISKAVRSPTRS